ncbi:MAG TPA: nucleotidyl transferase AbiEii/AbiGii toxin family protein [Verrucomicrobiae bacterium]
MDRQHPRDLFDVHRLFERDGLTSEVVECFVCYLAGHNRPVHEFYFRAMWTCRRLLKMNLPAWRGIRSS